MLVSPAVRLGEYRKEPRRQVARESKVRRTKGDEDAGATDNLWKERRMRNQRKDAAEGSP